LDSIDSVSSITGSLIGLTARDAGGTDAELSRGILLIDTSGENFVTKRTVSDSVRL